MGWALSNKAEISVLQPIEENVFKKGFHCMVAILDNNKKSFFNVYLLYHT